MKRFHVHVAVRDLNESVRFYPVASSSAVLQTRSRCGEKDRLCGERLRHRALSLR
jgi:hypothetical protein